MMLKKVVAFSLAQRLLLVVLMLVLIGAGVRAFFSLPIDAFPDVSSTQVKLILKAPGLTPEEIENRIVAPIEQELLGLPHQVMLRSQSKYAIADITLDFEDGTDVYWARQQVAERLNGIMKDLPSSVNGGLAPVTTPLGEILMFTIDGPMTLTEKRNLLDWTIRPQLRSIAGVADVNTLGGLVKSFEVIPDPIAMAARKISMQQLLIALDTNNRNDGAGRVDQGEESVLVRIEGSVRTIEDIGMLIVRSSDGIATRVREIATVKLGELTRYGTVTKDGQSEAVEGLILAMRGANAQRVVEQVKEKFQQLEATLPKGTQIKVFYDRGNLVERAVKTVSSALAEATILVIVLLYLFLGNLRSALVVALILPLSALGTFVLMQAFGLTANLMSLGGLAIAIGMLVDAAVVVVENVESHSADRARPNFSRLHIIYRAVSEVATPVTAGMAIIMIVFLPLLSLQGLEGKLFAPVAMTITFAIAVSLVLSLTVIPVVASMLIKSHEAQIPWLVRILEASYQKVLNFSLKRSRTVFAVAIVLLVATALLFPFIGKSFMPVLDEGDIIMQIEKLPSINLNESANLDRAIQRRILGQVPDVQSAIARVGSDELGLDPMGLNETDTFLVLKPRKEWKSKDKEELIAKIRQVTDEFPGVNFSFTQPIEMRTSEMLSGVRGDLAVKIFGSDSTILAQLSNQVVQTIQSIRGSEDVLTVKNSGVQYLQMKINPDVAGRLGLSVDTIQADLRTLIEGRQVGVVIDSGIRRPLIVRGKSNQKMSVESFQQLRLPIQDGQSIAIRDIAQIDMVDGPVKIERENSSRMVVVRANVRGRDLVGFVDEAKTKVAEKIKLPEGYRLSWGGQFENQQRAAARLAVVVPIALSLIFFLLFVTLGSLRQSILVLANIPFAMSGGIIALAVTGEYLSVPASVGFIALMGIAVLNGLVLITHFNQLVAQGIPISRVVSEGALRRFRPVMMTASITAFGLIPLLLASGPGSEIQRPLAVVVIGGLISATALTLILLPILFERFGINRTSNPT